MDRSRNVRLKLSSGSFSRQAPAVSPKLTHGGQRAWTRQQPQDDRIGSLGRVTAGHKMPPPPRQTKAYPQMPML